MIKIFVLAFVAAVGAVKPIFPFAFATKVSRVAVVVGGQVISEKDIVDRGRMVLLSTEGTFAQERFEQLRSQIEHALVEESLQLDAAEKIQISGDEIRARIQEMEKMGGMEQGSLLRFFEENNIPIVTLQRQIVARLKWNGYIAEKYGSVVGVGADEALTRIAKHEEDQKKWRYRLLEITLYIDRPEDEEYVHANVQQILDMLRQGRPFMYVAQQLSQSPTKDKGGDLGWVTEGDVGPEVAAMEVGGIQVVRTRFGVTIYGCMDKVAPQDTVTPMTRETAENMLREEKLNLLSRRELLSLRRKKFYEKRPQE